MMLLESKQVDEIIDNMPLQPDAENRDRVLFRPRKQKVDRCPNSNIN